MHVGTHGFGVGNVSLNSFMSWMSFKLLMNWMRFNHMCHRMACNVRGDMRWVKMTHEVLQIDKLKVLKTNNCTGTDISTSDVVLSPLIVVG